MVKQRKPRVSANANKAYLVVKEERDCLWIVLPENDKERKLCLRSQLPGKLLDFFQIRKSNAEKQIYRFINEVDMGTDELISDEDIPHVEWLSKTERVIALTSPTGRAELPRSTNGQLSDLQLLAVQSDQGPTAVFSREGDPIVISNTQTSSGYSQQRQAYIEIPAEVNHVQQAPDYHKVLAHVHSQTASVKWRNIPQQDTHTVRYQLTDFFTSLPVVGNELEAASRPTLFGSDALSNFRLGAVGELFVRYLSLQRMWTVTDKFC